MLADRPCEVQPGAADCRVEDRLEGFPLRRVCKDNGAKGRALQGPGGIEDTRSKMVPDGVEDRGVRSGQFVGPAVRVKDPKPGKK